MKLNILCCNDNMFFKFLKMNVRHFIKIILLMKLLKLLNININVRTQ